MDQSTTTLTYVVNGRPVTFVPRRRRTAALVVAAALAVLVVAIVACPTPASASVIDFFSDPVGAVQEMVKGWFDSAAQSELDQITGLVNGLADKSLFTKSFDVLLGSSDGHATGLADLAENVARVSIFPVACSMLSISFLLQLLKIAQRIDGNAAMPAVKETLMLFVYLALCVYVVGHSFGLVRDFYGLVNQWCIDLQVGRQAELALVADIDIGDIGALATFTGELVIVTLVCMVGGVITKMMFVARAVQIYLYSSFAPLMLSMLGLDELRGWGLGYIKGFLSCCLSGFVMIFAIAAFPYALGGLLGSSATLVDGVYNVTVTSASATGSFTTIMCVVSAVAGLCLKSGSFAREILGN